MRALASYLERIASIMSVAAIGVVALLAFPIFYDALARKAGHPTTWVFETTQYALIAGAFLANAYALRHGNHFRVQVAFGMFPRLRRAFDDLALASALAFGAIVAFAGGMLVHYSYANDIRSATIFSVPLYLPQLMIPLGGTSLALQAAAMLILRASPSEQTEFD